MKNAPKKIYLNLGPDPGDDFSKLHEVTWSDHPIDDGDIEYKLVPVIKILPIELISSEAQELIMFSGILRDMEDKIRAELGIAGHLLSEEEE